MMMNKNCHKVTLVLKVRHMDLGVAKLEIGSGRIGVNWGTPNDNTFHSTHYTVGIFCTILILYNLNERDNNEMLLYKLYGVYILYCYNGFQYLWTDLK